MAVVVLLAVLIFAGDSNTAQAGEDLEDLASSGGGRLDAAAVGDGGVVRGLAGTARRRRNVSRDSGEEGATAATLAAGGRQPRESQGDGGGGGGGLTDSQMAEAVSGMDLTKFPIVREETMSTECKVMLQLALLQIRT